MYSFFLLSDVLGILSPLMKVVDWITLDFHPRHQHRQPIHTTEEPQVSRVYSNDNNNNFSPLLSARNPTIQEDQDQQGLSPDQLRERRLEYLRKKHRS